MLATESEPQPRTGARLGQSEVGAAEQPASAAASHTTEVLTTTLHCKWFMLPMTLDMPDEGTR